MAVKIKKISENIADCERFSEFYSKMAMGSKVDTPYLQKANTYVFYRKDAPDKWLGGFCLNSEDEFRYLAGFQPEEVAALLKKHLLNLKDMIEITCLWLCSKSMSRFERIVFYSLLLLQVLISDKKMILGGSFIPKVAELHMKILPHLLYDGMVLVAGKQAKAKFYFASKSEIPLNFFKGLYFDLSKSFLKFGFKRTHTPIGV